MKKLLFTLIFFGCSTVFCSEKKPEQSGSSWWSWVVSPVTGPVNLACKIARSALGTTKNQEISKNVKKLVENVDILKKLEKTRLDNKLADLIEKHGAEISVFKNAVKNLKSTHKTKVEGLEKLIGVYKEYTNCAKQKDFSWKKNSHTYLIGGGVALVCCGVVVGIVMYLKGKNKNGEKVIKPELKFMPDVVEKLYDEMKESHTEIGRSLTTTLTDTKQYFLKQHESIGKKIGKELAIEKKLLDGIKKQYEGFGKDFKKVKIIGDECKYVIEKLIESQEEFLANNLEKCKRVFGIKVKKGKREATHVMRSDLAMNYMKINKEIKGISGFNRKLRVPFDRLKKGIDRILLRKQSIDKNDTKKYMACTPKAWEADVIRLYKIFDKKANKLLDKDTYEYIRLDSAIFINKDTKIHIADVTKNQPKYKPSKKESLLNTLHYGNQALGSGLNLIKK
ncbi:hypothetical protein KAH94_04545 [bacterium]|nr:hypothetical protein [bacterium]